MTFGTSESHPHLELTEKGALTKVVPVPRYHLPAADLTLICCKSEQHMQRDLQALEETWNSRRKRSRTLCSAIEMVNGFI